MRQGSQCPSSERQQFALQVKEHKNSAMTNARFNFSSFSINASCFDLRQLDCLQQIEIAHVVLPSYTFSVLPCRVLSIDEFVLIAGVRVQFGR